MKKGTALTKKWHMFVLKGWKASNLADHLKWDYEDHRPVEASLRQGMSAVMTVLAEDIISHTLITETAEILRGNLHISPICLVL